MSFNTEKILKEQSIEFGTWEISFKDGWWHADLNGTITSNRRIRAISETSMDDAVQRVLDKLVALLAERVVSHRLAQERLIRQAQYIFRYVDQPPLQEEVKELVQEEVKELDEHLKELDQIDQGLVGHEG